MNNILQTIALLCQLSPGGHALKDFNDARSFLLVQQREQAQCQQQLTSCVMSTASKRSLSPQRLERLLAECILQKGV